MTRATASLASIAGFLLLIGGVLLHRAMPVAGAAVMVTGTGVLSLYLIGMVAYDYVRHRRAKLLLRSRPQLGSAAFADKFFPGYAPLAAKLRDSLASFWNLNLDGLLPDDDLNEICDAQTDDPSLLWYLEDQFKLTEMPTTYYEIQSVEPSLRTFRSILHFVDARLDTRGNPAS